MALGYYASCAGYFVGNTLILPEVAQHGLWEIGIQRPLNRGVVTGCIITTITAFLSGRAGIEVGAPGLVIGVGAPVLLFCLARARLAPGQLAFNKATTRIRYWYARYYAHGEASKTGASLRSFRPAQHTIRLLKGAIDAQSRNDSSQGRINVATSHHELGLLYRIMNMWSEAEKELQSGKRVLETLLPRHANNTNLQQALSRILFRLAELDQAQGRLNDALDLYRASLRIDEQIGDASDARVTRELMRQIEGSRSR